MTNNVYTFFVAPALGCIAAISLVVVAYLASLEIKDRRRKRRMLQQLERIQLSRRCRRTSRYLSSPKATLIAPPASSRLNLGHEFQKHDRTSGWNSTPPNNLN
jgi:hypothetical protein